MTSVLDLIVKLPRYVKILASNGIGENNAVVLDLDKKERKRIIAHNHYRRNRSSILEKKRAYNRRPEVKKRSKERHHHYYQIHRESILAKKKLYDYKNKEQMKEYRKKYWLANKERLKLKPRNQSYYDKQYYERNRLKILAKKKAYNEQPHVKQHNAEYHHHYYLTHKSKYQAYRSQTAKKNGM